MTPKDKANELVEKFNNYCSYEWWEGNNGHKENMKQCALIAVDEILEATKVKWATQREYPNKEWKSWRGIAYKKYWLDVKNEITKL